MHYSSLFYSPYAVGLFAALIPLIIVLAIWSVIIKGFALWHSARGSQKAWFVVMLIVNTVGILEVIYLIWFRKDHGHGHHSS